MQSARSSIVLWQSSPRRPRLSARGESKPHPLVCGRQKDIENNPPDWDGEALGFNEQVEQAGVIPYEITGEKIGAQ